MEFSVCGILGRPVAQTRQDIEKRFSVSLKEALTVKNLEFKILVCIFSKICISCQFLKNHIFYHFYWCLAYAISKVHSDWQNFPFGGSPLFFFINISVCKSSN